MTLNDDIDKNVAVEEKTHINTRNKLGGIE